MEHIGKVLDKLDREEITHPLQTMTSKEKEPVCLICKGAGFIHPQLKSGGTDYSRVVACSCNQPTEEEIRKLLNVSTLENTFKNFIPQKGTEKAVKACQLLASGKTKWNLLLIYGPVGNGKTHLLEALAIELYKQGEFCRVMTYPYMMELLKSTMDKDSTLRLEVILNIWCRAERLIIDDVGLGGADSKWSMKMLEEIILARYRDGLFTVLSTNMDISVLPPTVISRLKDTQKSRMVENSGADYRPRKR